MGHGERSCFDADICMTKQTILSMIDFRADIICDTSSLIKKVRYCPLILRFLGRYM